MFFAAMALVMAVFMSAKRSALKAGAAAREPRGNNARTSQSLARPLSQRLQSNVLRIIECPDCLQNLREKTSRKISRDKLSFQQQMRRFRKPTPPLAEVSAPVQSLHGRPPNPPRTLPPNRCARPDRPGPVAL